jgi:hypothetical protein
MKRKYLLKRNREEQKEMVQEQINLVDKLTVLEN